VLVRPGRREQAGETSITTVPVLHYFRVFNAEQAAGLAPKFHPEPGSFTEITEPQTVLDAHLRHSPRLEHLAGDRADYNWRTTIRLPRREQFATPEGYY
jgi:antirestriction protein ArdC